MNLELVMKMLFKFMGVNEEQMREVFDNGHRMFIDAHQQIDTMNKRLARIEARLGIVETIAIEDNTDGN